jgi:dUTP pyrophosphatase
MVLKFKKLYKDAIIPKYQTKGAVGMDLHAYVSVDVITSFNTKTSECDLLVPTIAIPAGQQFAVETGLSVAVPEGWEMQIRPRSGLALKNKITITNAPGTLDPDFRGPIKVILFNLGKEPFYVKNGDRIAQAVIGPVFKPEIVEVNELEKTERGEKGFGSTGT